jgi:hypothetical protein
MSFPKVKSHELASCFNCEADLAGNRRFESSYPTEPRHRHRVQFVDRLAYAVRWRFHEAMTLQQAKSIARHLGLTLRMVRSGDYRVNFRDGNETTAYYRDNLEDAVKTAIEMARRRVVTKVCPNCKQAPC